MKKTNSLWGKFLQTFAPSNSPITFEKVKADIIPLLMDQLDNLKDLKVFMGPMEKKPEILFSQILVNRFLTLECEENLIDNSCTLVVFKKQKCILRGTLTKLEYHQTLTLFFDLLFMKTQQSGIEKLRNEVNSAQNETKLNSVESEQKSREWLRVTMEVYKKAMGQVATTKDLLIDFSLQFNQEENEPFVVFKSYNLFWQMKFLDSALLRVIFYNDQEAKKQNKPSLSGDFYHQKNQIWDEFTKTLSLINHTQSQK